MDELPIEFTADLIEVSEYSGYQEGILGAIQYISETERSRLRTDIEIKKMSIDLSLSRVDEARIIQEFQGDIQNDKTVIVLTAEKKLKRIHPLIDPISRLFSKRNRFNPEELKKLKILKNPEDTPEYMLIIHFGYNKQIQEYFIRNIQIQKKDSQQISS